MAKNNSEGKKALLFMREILLELTDEMHALSKKQILEELYRRGVLIKIGDDMFQSNIAALESAGMKIIRTRIQGDVTYHVEERDFELSELKFLTDIIYSSHFVSPKTTRILTKKIKKLTSVANRRDLDRNINLAGCVKSKNEDVLLNLDVIDTAIRENQMIRCHYYRTNLQKELEVKKKGRFYYLSPYTLVFDRENYYLIAYDEEIHETRHYRVDKIRDVSPTGRHRTKQEDTSGKTFGDYQNMLFNMYGGTEERVKLQFTNKMAGAVVDHFGPDVMMIPYGKDHFSISARVYVSEHFYGYICSLMNEVTIVSPPWVVEEFTKYLDAIRKKYIQ